MIVNLTTKVRARGQDGTWIELKPGQGCPTLKELLLVALRSPAEADARQGFKEKSDRFFIEKRIAPEDYGDDASNIPALELTEGECAILRDRVGRVFLQASLVGAIGELLDTKVKPA